MRQTRSRSSEQSARGSQRAITLQSSFVESPYSQYCRVLHGIPSAGTLVGQANDAGVVEFSCDVDTSAAAASNVALGRLREPPHERQRTNDSLRNATPVKWPLVHVHVLRSFAVDFRSRRSRGDPSPPEDLSSVCFAAAAPAL